MRPSPRCRATQATHPGTTCHTTACRPRTAMAAAASASTYSGAACLAAAGSGAAPPAVKGLLITAGEACVLCAVRRASKSAFLDYLNTWN